MLKCETNNNRVEAKIMTAARKYFHQRNNIHAVFEHGQWWILRAGAGDLTETYSVNDAEGLGTVGGFSFEQC